MSTGLNKAASLVVASKANTSYQVDWPACARVAEVVAGIDFCSAKLTQLLDDVSEEPLMEALLVDKSLNARPGVVGLG